MWVKRFILDELKCIPGWRTRERFVVFNVDDYGNVRLASQAAKQNLSRSGLTLQGRFDNLDALETRNDLHALLDVLSSVRDSRGRSAVFTPYAVSANPDFEALRQHAEKYRYEDLITTFARSSAADPRAYEGAWELWQEAIDSGLFTPQFHGREHLNLRLLTYKLARRDPNLIANIENNSMAGLMEEQALPGIGFSHAFGIVDITDSEKHKKIISDGLALFARVFRRPAQTFTPPAQRLHPQLYEFLERMGLLAIDKPFYTVRQLDIGKSRREINTLGRRRGQDHVTLVRNAVFEPTLRPNTDEVSRTLSQISTLFRWGKPAMISSHRVNFCGHIDPANRRAGLADLRRLLQAILKRWPDVKFIGAGELAERIIAHG
jgi:hypothetical protein